MSAINLLAIAKRLQYHGDSEYSSNSSPVNDTCLYRTDKNSSEKMTAQEVPAHSMIVRIAVNANINNSKIVRCRYYNRLIEELHVVPHAETEDVTLRSIDPYVDIIVFIMT